jgi:hypothetical protein
MGKPTRAKQIQDDMMALKPKVFEELHIEPSPRADKVFDLCVSGCMWAVYDGAHTMQTVLPYLTRTMQEQMASAAYAHLKGMSESASRAAETLFRGSR